MISFMNNKDKILKKLRSSSMSYLARYEVSTYQFENILKRKMSYYDSELNEKEKINILDSKWQQYLNHLL